MIWTAFTTADLEHAKREGLELEKSEALRLSGCGTLETAPIVASFSECVVCWNALTPLQSSMQLELRVQIEGRWSPYLRLAHWSDDPNQNSSYNESAEGVRLETDTVVCATLAQALQLRVHLEGAVLTGLVASFAVQPSSSQPQRSSAWGLVLDVPRLSQMVYPDGGRVWCSPTSTTMLLGYWEQKLGRPLAHSVPEAARAVWDKRYGGAGNWAFNMAYASRSGLRAYVAHLGGFAEAEALVARGIPLALSIGWREGELAGAPIGHSSGHLVVLCGFTPTGDPVVNDPAHPSDAAVRVVYKRAELERAWLLHSKGVVYVLEPSS
ncbi:MAG: C39 family peptidase [Deinococcales bacterium]